MGCTSPARRRGPGTAWTRSWHAAGKHSQRHSWQARSVRATTEAKQQENRQGRICVGDRRSSARTHASAGSRADAWELQGCLALCAPNKRGDNVRVRVLPSYERLHHLADREVLAAALQRPCLERRKVPRGRLLVFEQDRVRDEHGRTLMIHASRLQQVVLGPEVLVEMRH